MSAQVCGFCPDGDPAVPETSSLDCTPVCLNFKSEAVVVSGLGSRPVIPSNTLVQPCLQLKSDAVPAAEKRCIAV